MSTLAKIIYNLKNLPNKGTHSDDQKLSNRQLEFIVNHFRVALAGQRSNNKKSLDGFYQDLSNVKLTRTKDFKPYLDEIQILRSENKIPSIATANDIGYLFKFVGFRDGFIGAQQSSVSTYNIDLNHSYVRNIFFINDNYLYFGTRNNSIMREIFIKAVFNDPRAALKFEDTSAEFLEYDWEYPISDGLINQLNNMIMHHEYQWMNIIPADVVNDGKDA